MWVVGDWGQDSPWARSSGVKMAKGENGVYTGELSLPKGTKFDIKILKSSVSTTSGGNNTWSAVRYASTLNISASHDFGEFTDNLIPNGNFDEGQVKWTPAEQIITRDYAESKPYLTTTSNASCISDVFTVPASQPLRLSGYIYVWANNGTADITVESVEPQQRTLLKLSPVASELKTWNRFSGSFKSDDTPMKCRVVIAPTRTGAGTAALDTLSLVSP